MTEGRMSDHLSRPPSESEVREALSRIIGSDPFRSAPQLVAFLTFVVEKTVAGESGELKGYTIATRALGRPPEFDPQIDPIVRVEAMRLRRALQAYYAGAGAADPLIISIPRGSYVPHFAPRIGLEAPAGHLDGSPTDWTPEPPSESAALVRRRFPAGRAALALSLGAVVGLIGLLLAADALWHGSPGRAPVPVFPLVAVGPVDAEAGAVLDASALREEIIHGLARFDEIAVVEAEAGRAEQRLYRLAVRAAASGGLTSVTARLVHAGSGEVVWSGQVDAGGGDEPAKAGIARQIATRIASPYGVVTSDQRARRQDDPRSACLSRVYTYWFGPTEENHALARTCLEQDFASGPPNALALAYLAYVYLDEVRSGYNPRPGSLDRALESALKAVEYAPESARAHQVLMNVRFGRGEVAAAVETGRRAVALNPIDPDVAANFGARLVEIGRYREGLDLLALSERIAPEVQSWRSIYTFLAHYMLGEIDHEAAAATRTPPDHPLGLMARILVAAREGRVADVDRHLERLRTLHPETYRNPAGVLVRRRLTGDVVARITGELSKAGLEGVVSGALPGSAKQN